MQFDGKALEDLSPDEIRALIDSRDEAGKLRFHQRSKEGRALRDALDSEPEASATDADAASEPATESTSAAMNVDVEIEGFPLTPERRAEIDYLAKAIGNALLPGFALCGHIQSMGPQATSKSEISRITRQWPNFVDLFRTLMSGEERAVQLTEMVDQAHRERDQIRAKAAEMASQAHETNRQFQALKSKYSELKAAVEFV